MQFGFYCETPCSSVGLCMTYSEVYCGISSQGLGSFSRVLQSKVQLSPAERKADKMSGRISLTLEASEMFLSLHMVFSLKRAAVVWAILEIISSFDPSLEMIILLTSDFLSCSLFGSHLGCLSSFSSCLDHSPFCTLWWLHQDGLPGRKLLLPLLYLHQCHQPSITSS